MAFINNNEVLFSPKIEIDLNKDLLEGTLTTLYNKDATKIVGCSFADRTDIASIQFENVEVIENGAGDTWGVFRNCCNLETIILPKCLNIGHQCFSACPNIKTIYLPKVEVLNVGCFAWGSMPKVSFLELPRIKTIGYSVFYDSGFKGELIIGTENAEVCTLENTDGMDNVAAIYVPDALVESYKAATNWASLSALIQPISERAV